MRNNFEISKDALEYYVKRLEALKDDDEVLVGRSMITEDVTSNTKLTSKALNSLQTQSNNFFKDYTKTICSALILYLKGLEQSKTMIEAKLEREIHFEWEKMDEEIEAVKTLQRDLNCKSHG